MASALEAPIMAASHEGPCIPEAQVWAPSPTTFNVLPLPPHDTLEMRKILASAQKRRETAAMRNLWKMSRNAQSVLLAGKPSKPAPNAGGHTGRWPTLAQSQGSTTLKGQESRSSKGQRAQSPRKSPAAATPGSRRQASGRAAHGESPVLRPGSELSMGACGPRDRASPSRGPRDRASLSRGPRDRASLSRQGTIVMDEPQGPDRAESRQQHLNLPTIRINPLGVDWMGEIRKDCEPRPNYSTPSNIVVDKMKIRRQVQAKRLIAKRPQPFFIKTAPFFKDTYTIDPTWESEYFIFNHVPPPPDTPKPAGDVTAGDREDNHRPCSVPASIYSHLGKMGKKLPTPASQGFRNVPQYAASAKLFERREPLQRQHTTVQ